MAHNFSAPAPRQKAYQNLFFGYFMPLAKFWPISMVAAIFKNRVANKGRRKTHVFEIRWLERQDC